MLYPRPATVDDISWMSSRLRIADILEVKAAAGLDPWGALRDSYNNSSCRMVGADEKDRPVCMGGVVPAHFHWTSTPLSAVVWMLATTDLEHHQMSFLRQSKVWLEKWHQDYPVLFNCVDERNELHIKWLRWLGFVFIRRHPEWGFEKRPFLEFVRLHHV